MRALEAIGALLHEELQLGLGVGRHERGAHRRGYRHGSIRRHVTTSEGLVELETPRARIFTEEGTEEFRSE